MKCEDKQTRVRHWLLNNIDNGSLQTGQKLPGARSIAEKLEVSLLTVQNAIETLANEGILETIARQGTFVSVNWRECILQYNFRANNPKLPWLPGLNKIISQTIPKLYFCSGFHHGMVELRPTLYVQATHNQFLDMNELFEHCFPDKSDFFMEAFSSYYCSDGKLPGVPFIFSPRVMFFNKDLLNQAGCNYPQKDWTWQDFMSSIHKLKKILPAEQIFNWNADHHQWLNLIFRTGGSLFSTTNQHDPVCIDSPETIRGLRLFQQLHEELDRCPAAITEQYRINFGQGKAAFMLAPRQDLFFIEQYQLENWGTCPMPKIDNGNNLTTQAADLICIKKNCSNLKMAETFLKQMLSDEVQAYIGSQHYGIPIRKSAAYNSISADDPRDKLFLDEIPNMSAQYNLNSQEIMNIVLDGINHMWQSNDDIDVFARELASATRTFLRIQGTVTNLINQY